MVRERSRSRDDPPMWGNPNKSRASPWPFASSEVELHSSPSSNTEGPHPGEPGCNQTVDEWTGVGRHEQFFKLLSKQIDSWHFDLVTVRFSQSVKVGKIWPRWKGSVSFQLIASSIGYGDGNFSIPSRVFSPTHSCHYSVRFTYK